MFDPNSNWRNIIFVCIMRRLGCWWPRSAKHGATVERLAVPLHWKVSPGVPELDSGLARWGMFTLFVCFYRGIICWCVNTRRVYLCARLTSFFFFCEDSLDSHLSMRTKLQNKSSSMVSCSKSFLPWIEETSAVRGRVRGIEKDIFQRKDNARKKSPCISRKK